MTNPPPNDPSVPTRDDPKPPSIRSTVLLVEDDEGAAESYRHALSECDDLDLIHVTSGDQAIEQLDRFSAIRCVVCAVELPDMDGFDVLRASKVVRPLVSVLLISKTDKPEFRSRARTQDADDLLFVPVEDELLRSRVGLLIERTRLLRESRARSVLAIGAHPDDIEIGAGGTLLQHVAAGDRVVHLMMTDGEVGGDKGDRVEEAERAAEFVGLKLIRGKLRDAFLSDARETVGIVEQAVADHHPSIVYVHSRHDRHQDHRATFHATLSAARAVPMLCCYQSPSSTVAFHPDRFMDIGDYLDSKIELINVYRSQASTRLYLAEDLIRATARYWGRHASHRLVEPLETVWQFSI